MIKLFKKLTSVDKSVKYEIYKELEYKGIFEPDFHTEFENMACEKYGYLGRGEMPYYFNYQNLHFTGTGIIVCKCNEMKELDFEILCTDKLDLICKKSNNDYITTFFINSKIIHSCRHDPKELVVYYDIALNCTKTVHVMVDH
jgi:hypothetical protein